MIRPRPSRSGKVQACLDDSKPTPRPASEPSVTPSFWARIGRAPDFSASAVACDWPGPPSRCPPRSPGEPSMDRRPTPARPLAGTGHAQSAPERPGRPSTRNRRGNGAIRDHLRPRRCSGSPCDPRGLGSRPPISCQTGRRAMPPRGERGTGELGHRSRRGRSPTRRRSRGGRQVARMFCPRSLASDRVQAWGPPILEQGPGHGSQFVGAIHDAGEAVRPLGRSAPLRAHVPGSLQIRERFCAPSGRCPPSRSRRSPRGPTGRPGPDLCRRRGG